MQQFTSVKLEPWQIQPIHNYFLLTAAELGIAGAILLLGFFLWHLAKIGKSLIWQKIDDENVHRLILAVILFTFLVLMLFDHYFYTIHQAQLLLWLILGLIMREIAIVKMKST
jgi:sterol desaturase/sphingolipid hydroxylase (fatty acid hydroxylase superfamily)